MKKILVLSSFPAPYRIGVFKGLLDEYDLDIFFATDIDQNRNKDYFIKKEQFNYNVITDKIDKKLYKKCLKNIMKYDLILAYDWYLPFAIKAQILARVFKIPYIINCDGAFIDKEKRILDKLKYKLKSILVKNATLCFASGEYAKEYFLYYGAKEENIRKHNFTSLYKKDIEFDKISSKEKKIIKQKYKLNNKKTILSIGQFIHRKGFDILLDSWKEFDQNNQLILIGGGEQESYYRQKVKQLNLKNVYIMAYMTKEDIQDLYRISDIFVLATREDIWGLVINEALAHGLPVITTNRCIAGLELISENFLGRICNPSVEGIKNSIRDVEKMIEEDQEKIRKKCLNKIENYTIEEVVQQHLKDINSLF